MKSSIKRIKKDGELQRYQIVTDFSFADLMMVKSDFDPGFIREIARLYRAFIVPKHMKDGCGKLVFFHLPEEFDIQMPQKIQGITYLDRMSNFTAWLEDDPQEAGKVIEKLRAQGLVEEVDGGNDGVRYMPVSDKLLFPSGAASDKNVTFNAHFFLMDPDDCQGPWDHFGTPYGLTVEKGSISLPPVHHRPAFAVSADGECSIIHPELNRMTVMLGEKSFRHDKGCHFYERPDCEITPEGKGTAFVIRGTEVVAYKPGGGVKVPMGGFVLQTDEPFTPMSWKVVYLMDAHYSFALQVGPAIMERGREVKPFNNAPFFNPKPGNVPFPPTIYPLDWYKGRAGRMVLGCDDKNQSYLIWAESFRQTGNRRGRDSEGCSLSELGAFCKEMGLRDAINLDGGGSSQIVFKGKRYLHLKDCDESGNECERPVPGVLEIV